MGPHAIRGREFITSSATDYIWAGRVSEFRGKDTWVLSFLLRGSGNLSIESVEGLRERMGGCFSLFSDVKGGQQAIGGTHLRASGGGETSTSAGDPNDAVDMFYRAHGQQALFTQLEVWRIYISWKKSIPFFFFLKSMSSVLSLASQGQGRNFLRPLSSLCRSWHSLSFAMQLIEV